MTARKEANPPPDSLQLWAAELEAAATIARSVATTPFTPDSLKRWLDSEGNPTTEKERRVRLDFDATVAIVTAALLAGQELGLKPMASLRSIDIVDGVPVLRAHALRGILLHEGHEIAVVETTNTRAIVRARRADSETVQTSTWTIDRARQLGVADRPNYRRQPATMLVNRATAEIARWVAGDAIIGMPYSDADFDALDVGDGDEQLAIEGAKRKPQRRRSSATLALPAAVVPPQGEPGNGEQRTQPAAGRQAARKISKTQSDRMHAMFRELGIGKDDALGLIRGWTKRTVAKTDQLTYGEAGAVLRGLDELAARKALHDADARDDAADDALGDQGDQRDDQRDEGDDQRDEGGDEDGPADT